MLSAQQATYTLNVHTQTANKGLVRTAVLLYEEEDKGKLYELPPANKICIAKQTCKVQVNGCKVPIELNETRP